VSDEISDIAQCASIRRHLSSSRRRKEIIDLLSVASILGTTVSPNDNSINIFFHCLLHNLTRSIQIRQLLSAAGRRQRLPDQLQQFDGQVGESVCNGVVAACGFLQGG
jgi:hypothetical protein